MQFQKYAQQRNERDLKIRLVPASLTTAYTGTSSTSVPEGFTKVRAKTPSSGIYDISYNQPFMRLPIVTATAFHASLRLYPTISDQTLSSCQITFVDAAGAVQTPTQVHVKVEGFDVADQV